MNYVFFVFRNGSRCAELPGHQLEALEIAIKENEQELSFGDVLNANVSLQSGPASTMVHVLDGLLSVTTTYSSNEPEVSRLYFVRAKDLNEAILIASRMPQVHLGSIEIHPVVEADIPLSTGLQND